MKCFLSPLLLLCVAAALPLATALPLHVENTALERAAGPVGTDLVMQTALDTISHGRNHNGDSFFVTSLPVLVERFRLWQRHLPFIKPYYAVKCNPDPQMVRVLGTLGAGFDCASMAEQRLVLDAGIDPSRIIYANPAKQPSHIMFARDHKVDLTVVDSVFEVEKLARLHPEGSVLVRIITDDRNASTQLSNKYGAPLATAKNILDVAKTKHLRVRGVAFHVGSGQSSVHAYTLALQHAKELFVYASGLGIEMDTLDIGGGFPGNDEGKISFATIAIHIKKSLGDIFGDADADKKLPKTLRILAEPGRYFAQQVHTLAVGVIAKRFANNPDGSVIEAARSRPHTMLYLNDGIYGNLNNIVLDDAEPHFEVALRHDRRSAATCPTSLWGPTCDGLDRITNDRYVRTNKMEIELPCDLGPGDWMITRNQGAYTRSGVSDFNGMRPTASNVYIPPRDGTLTPHDFWAHLDPGTPE